MIEALRWAMVIVWTAVLIGSATGVASIIGRQGRHGDPMRLACFLVALCMVGGNLWWLTGVSSAELYALVLGIGTVAGGYTLGAMWAYGRGHSR